MQTSRGRRPIIYGTVFVLSAVVVAALVLLTISQPEGWYERRVDFSPKSLSVAESGAFDSEIESFCATCHAMPTPESFPRDAWHDEVLRGYEFYARSGMTHLKPPPVEATVAYFRSRAPEELVLPNPAEAAIPMRANFTLETWESEKYDRVAPAIAHLRWTRLETDGVPVLLACDMRTGDVTAVDPNDRANRIRHIVRLDYPCHVEACDFDADGAIDIVAADLGSFVPYDHDRGRVVWLRRQRRTKGWETIVLASELGRVADVRPGDLDGDGDLDLAVGDFGLHRTGGVLWLETLSVEGGPPRCLLHRVDPRPGTIHVPVVDLDGDGRLDFLALISQEHECIEAFMNRRGDVGLQGGTMFVRNRLWTGPDLTFGSSGIEPVDMDGDGDMDVLYANGDAFDNNYANPAHGIQWLENVEGEFIYHRLTDFLGACRALAEDMDLDGDLDVIATAWLPQQLKPASLRNQPLDSVICLEQTEPGVFVRHTLERGSPHHAALELADFDEDGDIDFAVGTHVTASDRLPWLTIWRNDVK